MKSYKNYLIVFIIIIMLVMLSLIINSIFLLRKYINQNSELISFINNFNSKSSISSGDKYK